MREAIVAAGTNPNQVSLRMGVSYSTVNDWLTEVSEPELGNLVAFAKVTGVALEWLAGLEDEKRAVREGARFPSLDAFLASGYAAAMSPPPTPGEVAELEREWHRDGDPGEAYYYPRLLSMRARLRSPMLTNRPDIAQPAVVSQAPPPKRAPTKKK